MEMANGMSQGQDITTSSPGSNQADVSRAQIAPAQTAEERLFKQSEVNDIVKRAKYGAVEDFKRNLNERPDYLQQKYPDLANQQNQPTNTQHNQIPQSEDNIRRLAAEEAQRLRDQWVQEARNQAEVDNAKRIVENFWNKVAPGKEKYSDFEKVTGSIPYARFPNVVQLLASHIDNSHDVLYALGNDMMKLVQLEQTAREFPEAAIVQAQRLSQSLKDNEAASQVRVPNEPLSQMRPSNTGTDNGVMGVRDYRRKYKV